MSAPPFLDRAAVERLAAGLDVEGALAAVLVDAVRGAAGQNVRSVLVPPVMPGVIGLMTAFRATRPRRFATKIVCVMPDNPGRGLPAHQGLTALFDGGDGHVIGLAEAGAVTEIRTAALTALATRHLARPGARRHLVAGAGHQALPHLRALARAFPDGEFTLWARRRDAAPPRPKACRPRPPAICRPRPALPTPSPS